MYAVRKVCSWNTKTTPFSWRGRVLVLNLGSNSMVPAYHSVLVGRRTYCTPPSNDKNVTNGTNNDNDTNDNPKPTPEEGKMCALFFCLVSTVHLCFLLEKVLIAIREWAARLMQEYGSTYLAVQIGISFASFIVLWVFVGKLCDFPLLLAVFGMPGLAQSTIFSAGNGVAVAYVIHRSLLPVRIPIAIALTPIVAKMNRENSVTFRVVGEFVDRVPMLRYLRDDVWATFMKSINNGMRGLAGKGRGGRNE